jgi:hypothetical protein
MITHDILPTTDTWTSGEAQQYGWSHLVNSSGVYGAYGHMLVAHRAIPTDVTLKRVNAIRERIAEDGCIVLRNSVIVASDVVIANAMKPDGEMSTDGEAWDVGLNVGIYILKPVDATPTD